MCAESIVELRDGSSCAASHLAASVAALEIAVLSVVVDVSK